MSKNNWTDQLPELFEGYTEAEPEGLWDAVQGAMAPKSKKATAAWWWYGAAALAAAACVAVGVFLFRNDTAVIPSEGTTVISSEVEKSLAVVDVPDSTTDARSESGMTATEPEETNTETGMTECDSKDPSAISNNGSIVISTEVEKSIKSNGTASSCPTPIGHLEADNGVQGEISYGNDDEVVKEEAQKVENEEIEGKKEEVKQTEAEKEWNDIINGKEEGSGKNNRTRKPTEVKLKVGASTGQYLAQDVTRTTRGYGLPVSYPGMPVTKAAGTTTGLSPMMLSRNKPSTTDAVHHRTSRYGVTFGANIGRRWGVESGLYLTTLKTSYSSESGTAKATTEREMHYIGFPLHLQCRIWWYGGFSLYGMAGPMFETSYRTRTTTVQVLGDNRDYTTDRTNVRDNRWSLQAGAGAQLEFLPGCSLFVQPSLSWHLPNDNGLENAYTEHPLAPELFFGVRITFK